MNCNVLISFFITFIVKDISTSPFNRLSSKYDITKTFENSIQSIYPSIAEIWKFLSHGEKKSEDFTFSSKVGNKTYFCDLIFDSYRCDDFKIVCDLINKKVVLTVDGYHAKTKGWIKESSNPKSKHFTDQWISCHSGTTFESDRSIVNFSSDASYYYDYLSDRGDAEILTEGLLKPSLIKQTSNQLAKRISTQLNKFAVEMDNNTGAIFTSKHPSFLRDEEKHYYLIPNIPLISFNLTKITIKGLTNFYKLETTKKQLFYTLWIRNVRGEITLDYGSEIEAPLKLNFDADYLMISVDSNASSINVQLRNYQVFRTTQNTSVTDHQSAMIIQRIESAMAASLMPSMKVWWTKAQLSRKYIMESSGGEMYIAAIFQHSDFETKKKIFEKWIPFNEVQDHITTAGKLYPTDKNRTDSLKYRVILQNLTINLISKFTYPEKLRCELPNNLNITREIRATPITTEISTNNGTRKDNEIDINFHVNFPFVSFSTNISNSSRENDSCEYQLINNEEIVVNLPPVKNISGDGALQLKKKIDTTLISMAKERIISTIKPAFCLSYNVCKGSAQILHDLFHSYIDKVLQKCSLQRIKSP